VVTKLIERLRRSEDVSLEVLFGRSHLARMMTHGHQAGVLSDVQGQLAAGLLQIAPQSVTGSMTPVQRVQGVPATATRDEVLRFAERHGLSSVSVRRSPQVDDWYGQLTVADLALNSRPVSALIRPLPRVDHCASKLDALHVMCEARQSHAIVVDGERVLGLVSQLALTEQMFQPAPSAVPLADQS
jgi:magnesium and cobalt exporter, CNNM family